jgi:hypothetical protein
MYISSLASPAAAQQVMQLHLIPPTMAGPRTRVRHQLDATHFRVSPSHTLHTNRQHQSPTARKTSNELREVQSTVYRRDRGKGSCPAPTIPAWCDTKSQAHTKPWLRQPVAAAEHTESMRPTGRVVPQTVADLPRAAGKAAPQCKADCIHISSRHYAAGVTEVVTEVECEA